ncbi:CUBN [Branchiostoma lanceolatum]|uniref:CUBN protein n=1 Tax=Branchiostoma lanceolatum TaxID=7740 RepID=A0A8K0EYN4_BRALA|nr:CUBN [Branchiostoma lanceolatum]
MPSNKFYCGAILFFAGVLLATVTTIVVVMVATPSNNNNATATEVMVVVENKVKQGTSVSPAHDEGKPLLLSSPTPMNKSFPKVVSTSPTTPTGGSTPAVRKSSSSSPRTLANPSQLTTSHQTMAVSFPNVKTTLPRKINTRTSQITTSRLLVQITNPLLPPLTSTNPISVHTTLSEATTSFPPKVLVTTRISPKTTRAFPITNRTSTITTSTSPITTSTSPITTRTSPITTWTSSITTSPTVHPAITCPENDTTRVFAGNGTVSSPRFPYTYPPNMCHTWIFWTSPGKSVFVKFLYFHVEMFYRCSADKVTIVIDGVLPGQKYCGGGDYYIPVPSNITGRTVEVTMVSDSADEEMGFRLEYGTIP